MTDRRGVKDCGVLMVLALLSAGILSGGGLTAAAGPPGLVYVTSERSGELAVVDGTSLEILRRIEIGKLPHNLEITPNGLVVIATQGAEAVTVVDPSNDAPTVRRYAIGAPPHDVALGKGGRTVDVLSSRGALLRLDPTSGRVSQRVGLEGSPHNMIVAGGAAWITDVSSRRLLIVDQDQRVRELPISIVGHDLAMRPASDELWVTPWSSTRVVVVAFETQEEIAALRVGRDAAHKHVAFTEDGSQAWITEPSSGSLFVVDAPTRKVLDAVDLAGHPHHVRFAAGRAYVAVGPGELVVLDVTSRAVVGRQAVGPGVHDVALSHPVN
jgi:DNA-binding beta-propeller fold protein YncE